MFVRRNVLAPILMLLLPGAVFVAVVLYDLNQREQEEAEGILARTATATIATLDRQLASQTTALTVLASSPALDGGDLAGFVEQARRVVAAHDAWLNIAITDPQKLLASTLTGVIVPRRPLIDPKSAAETFRTGRPYVSGIFPANERMQEPFYVVRVPVIRDGGVKYTLTGLARAWSLHAVLRQLPVPEGGRIGFLDRDGRIIARSSSADARDGLIGKLPSESVLAGAMQGGDKLFRATPLDGDPVHMVGRKHEPSGWTAVVSAPVAVLEAPRLRILALASAGAATVLLLTIAVGLAMARSATRRIEAERRVAAFEAEAGKRRVENLLAKVMDALPVGVFVSDASGQIISVNPEAQRIWGSPPRVGLDQYVEYKGWHRDTGRRIEGHEWAAARALLQGETVRHEIVDIESFDGHRKTAIVSAHPLFEQKRIVGAVSIISDITDHIRVQDELRVSNEGMRLAIREAEAAREEAERANLSKSKFLAAASHDVRQPAQALFFMLSALEGRVKPGAERTLAHANEALTALKSLLDSLLDVSQLDAGVIKTQVEEFPISALLEQIEAEHRPAAEAKGLEWHVVGCTATVRSDPALLARMLRNLCQNALKYTGSGSIVVRCRPVRDTLRIEVEDTGIGIPPDKQGEIFEEFKQLHNEHRDRKQGLGLGLAIVQRLSTLLGHPVEVRSAPGEGATFSITVPMTVAPMVPRTDAETIAIAQGDGQLVVVIDDDALVRTGIRMMVESWGYDALDAATGPEALAALQADPRVPDLIISDYRLPAGRSGIDVIRSIRAHFRRAIPAILLTGETTRECLQDAEADDIAVIHKPVSSSHLHAVLSVKAARADRVGRATTR